MKKQYPYYLFVAAAMVLNACSGGAGLTEQTKEMPVQTEGVKETETKEGTFLQADPVSMKEMLYMVTSRTRASGTRGEAGVGADIRVFFNQLGYDVELQPFVQDAAAEDGVTVTGTNVIATKKARKQDADILVISAHHDAKPGIEGAIDNASGVVVMMETARLVSGLPSDTEIRFISFAGEEDGRVGSRYYVDQLPDSEKSRIIGAIQLDELGYVHSEGLKLYTADGQETLLGQMVASEAKEGGFYPETLTWGKESLSDHHSFFARGIPAVMLAQDAFSFENHSIQDKQPLVDMEKASKAAQLMVQVVQEIMSEDSSSLKEASYEQNPARSGYPVQKDTVIYFGMDRNFVENMLGTGGKQTSQETNEFGDQVEEYTYSIRWFDMEEAIDSLFQYRNGFLETIQIPMEEATGLNLEKAKVVIEAFMGVPSSYDGAYGTDYGWEDGDYLKYISMNQKEDGGYELSVLPFSVGRSMGASYDLSRGWDALMPENPLDEKIMDMMKQVFYSKDLPFIQLDVFSDGKGNITGFTTAIEPENNHRMQYALDPVDIFDEKGNFLSYNKTIKTAVHEYGHFLTLRSEQLDISKQDPTMPSVLFSQETYGQDAYMRSFYERFWKGQDVRSGQERYREYPQEYVSAYGATDLAEDIAESFALFVLSDTPISPATVAEEKILFFYEYEELIMRREFIRENLGLTGSGQQETAPAAADALVKITEQGTVKITLTGNTTTGYSWNSLIDPDGVVEEITNSYETNSEQKHRTGTGGIYTFEWKGTKPGATRITLNYARPWESKAPAKTCVYEIQVDEQGKVSKVTEGKKTP